MSRVQIVDNIAMSALSEIGPLVQLSLRTQIRAPLDHTYDWSKFLLAYYFYYGW